MASPSEPKPVRSAYTLWLGENSADIVKNLPFKMSFKETMAHLGHVWRTLPDAQRQPYEDRRNAYLASVGRMAPTKRRTIKEPVEPTTIGADGKRRNKKRKGPEMLAGWKMEEIAGRVAWTHEASSALVWRKPLNRARILSSMKKQLLFPRSGYCNFVKDNFSKYKSLAACGAAWKEKKAAEAAAAAATAE